MPYLQSPDGNRTKLLLRLPDGQVVEPLTFQVRPDFDRQPTPHGTPLETGTVTWMIRGVTYSTRYLSGSTVLEGGVIAPAYDPDVPVRIIEPEATAYVYWEDPIDGSPVELLRV